MSTKEICKAVLEYDMERTASLTGAEIEAGTDLEEILNNGLIAALDEVGKQFTAGQLFVPEMLLAARTMKAGLEVIRPHLASNNTAHKGTIVIGTVKGDLHDIGKNLVSMMMEGAGFKVIDVGVDVETEKFLEVCNENNAQVVALSALLTTTMPAMAATVKAFKEAGSPTKVIVGGAPVTQTFADEIGADGYSEDAPGAVERARAAI
ncbi:MAG: cobalamin B12-binding domain-containing protein [Desulforhopalus sp.]